MKNGEEVVKIINENKEEDNNECIKQPNEVFLIFINFNNLGKSVRHLSRNLELINRIIIRLIYY